jgi:hypothetical protein
LIGNLLQQMRRLSSKSFIRLLIAPARINESLY